MAFPERSIAALCFPRMPAPVEPQVAPAKRVIPKLLQERRPGSPAVHPPVALPRCCPCSVVFLPVPRDRRTAGSPDPCRTPQPTVALAAIAGAGGPRRIPRAVVPEPSPVATWLHCPRGAAPTRVGPRFPGRTGTGAGVPQRHRLRGDRVAPWPAEERQRTPPGGADTRGPQPRTHLALAAAAARAAPHRPGEGRGAGPGPPRPRVLPGKRDTRRGGDGLRRTRGFVHAPWERPWRAGRVRALQPRRQTSSVPAATRREDTQGVFLCHLPYPSRLSISAVLQSPPGSLPSHLTRHTQQSQLSDCARTWQVPTAEHSAQECASWDTQLPQAPQTSQY